MVKKQKRKGEKIMAKKKVVVEINKEVIAVRTRLDSLVEEIKGVDADIAEFEALYNARLEEIKEQYESKMLTLKANRERILSQIAGHFSLAEPSQTKTQEKVALISGDIIKKKATLKMKPNREQLIAWAKLNGMDNFVKTKTTEDFDWAWFKEGLVIQEGLDKHSHVLDTITGEIIECIDVEIEPEKWEVR